MPHTKRSVAAQNWKSLKRNFSLTKELDISQKTILSLNMDLKVSQKELQTLNLEMEVSRQETRSLKAEVRKCKGDYKEALNNTETAKRDNLRLKEENSDLTDHVNEKLHELEKIKKRLEDEKFEAEHRLQNQLQNQLQGLRTHLQNAGKKQQTRQEENLQAAKEVQVLQERLITQYVPAKQHEKLKATLSITKASLEAKFEPR
ncbi:uncharacterized protein LOC142503227 [Ascaphus truei]|uniref:uncharacterized protein LOC142503227 n=1 Tax=Ascaphus truei TaxID=8439 RepID=UPI003F5AA56C